MEWLVGVEGIPLPKTLDGVWILALVLLVHYVKMAGEKLVEQWDRRKEAQLEQEARQSEARAQLEHERERLALDTERDERQLELRIAERLADRNDDLISDFIGLLRDQIAEKDAEIVRLRAKLRDTRHVLEDRGLEEVSSDLQLADEAPSLPEGREGADGG